MVQVFHLRKNISIWRTKWKRQPTDQPTVDIFSDYYCSKWSSPIPQKNNGWPNNNLKGSFKWYLLRASTTKRLPSIAFECYWKAGWFETSISKPSNHQSLSVLKWNDCSHWYVWLCFDDKQIGLIVKWSCEYIVVSTKSVNYKQNQPALANLYFLLPKTFWSWFEWFAGRTT